MASKIRTSHFKSASCLVGVHMSSAGGDIMYLICHLISHDHLTEGSCRFMGGSSLQHDTILASLVTTRTAIVEIQCLYFLPRSLVIIEVSHGNSYSYHVWWRQPLCSGRGVIMILICHVISQDHGIKGSCDLSDRNP